GQGPRAVPRRRGEAGGAGAGRGEAAAGPAVRGGDPPRVGPARPRPRRQGEGRGAVGRDPRAAHAQAGREARHPRPRAPGPAAGQCVPALSLKAVKAATRGGPPAPSQRDRYRGGGYRQTTIGGVQYLVQEGGEQQVTVDQALVTLVPKWRAAGVPAAQVYDVL